MIHAEHAELTGIVDRHRAGGDRRVGAGLMEGEHLIHVHPVDVVGAEDRDDVGVEVVDQIQILQHRIGGAPVPGGSDPHLRGTTVTKKSGASRWSARPGAGAR